MGQHHPRKRDRQLALSTAHAPPATTTTRAGGEGIRSLLGDPYWPGFYAFDDLLQAWRDKGDMDGLVSEE